MVDAVTTRGRPVPTTGFIAVGVELDHIAGPPRPRDVAGDVLRTLAHVLEGNRIVDNRIPFARHLSHLRGKG